MSKIKKNMVALLFVASLVLPVTLVTVTGCKSPSQQKAAVNTLFTIHKTADAALNGYLDLVVQGKIVTNAVPKVLAAYSTFQVAYNSAVTVVAANTNAVPPQALVDAASEFGKVVSTATRGGL